MIKRPYDPCPELDSDCPRNHSVDFIKCLQNYETCPEYQRRQERRENQTYGFPMGIGAMTSDDITKLLQEAKNEI